MDRVDYQSLVIQDLINTDKAGDLNLTPWYQRRSVWTDPQKAYLINSIMSGMPVPTIYIRHKLDIGQEKTIKEVVDGQQRIRSIFEFRADEFSFRHPISKDRIKYSGLTKQERETFLMTKLSVGVLIGASDGDVIDIFGRINSVAKTLNDQEKRNALFSGEFKQFCLTLASEKVEFWKSVGLFSITDISRMLEVRFTSELVLNMIDGLTDGGPTPLTKIYKRYDEEFPLWKKVSARFERIVGILADLKGIDLSNTVFSRQPLFFSLFLVLDEHKAKLSSDKLKRALLAIDERYNSSEPLAKRPQKDAQFYLASTSTTQRVAQRRVRQRYIASFLK